MNEDSSNKMSREERLAAKLRENLRRRKAQSRAQTLEMKDESPDNVLPKQDSES